jgi:16S rRNA (cytosine967-C5)-methyltransferase
LPDWWWKKLEKDYGYTDACNIARAGLERPETWFRLRDLAPLPPSFSEGPFPHSAKLLESSEGGIVSLPGYREGKWIVQDLASQALVDRFVQILGRSTPQPKVLDRCAAPGGKSVAMSWLGVDVFATDSSDSRRVLLEETIRRAAPEIKVIAETEISHHQPFSAVWIDAPCSGSGIFRRHPDVRWLRNESDIGSLVAIQSKLLREAFDLVPVGGFVFYSVCSLFAEEGRDHLKTISSLGRVREEIRLGPDQTPSYDGFFGAIIEKI